jgi:branched-chain amino acid transport system substrate-binding protein
MNSLTRREAIRLAGGAAGAAALLGGTRAFAAETIKIGGILSLSGPAASFGIPERDIIKAFVDNLNGKGGINGRLLEIIFHDDRTDPTEAVRGASKLVRQDGVVAILGSTTGNSTLAFLPIAARGKVPALALNATSSVTAASNSFFPWSFRACVNTDQMTQGALDAVVVKGGLKTVAVVHSEDAFGREGVDLVKALAQKDGKFQVVETASVPLNAIDLSTTAARIRNAKPDFTFIISSSAAMGAAFVRSARQIGYDGKIGGTVILAQKAFVDAAGPAGDGVIIAGFNNWDDPLPKEVELGKTMSAAGIPPAGYGEILGANGILILAEAIRRVKGDVTGDAIRDALETISDFDGTPMNGKVNISSTKHDAYGTEALVITRVEKGKLITVR